MTIRPPRRFSAVRVGLWSMVLASLLLFFNQDHDYGFQILIIAALFAIQVVSLNLLIGFTGLFSMAHVGLVAIGAYVTAILTRTGGVAAGDTDQVPLLGWSVLWAAPAAMALCALLGGLLMFAFRRLRDDYFSLATLGFAFVVQQVLFNSTYLTRGSLGLSSIPRPELVGIPLQGFGQFTALAGAALLLVCAVATALTRSSFGRVLKAVREDEEVAGVFGYRTVVYKVAIFSASSAIAGLAGALLASYIGFIAPNDFSLLQSLLLSAIVTAGGLASIEGSLLASLLWVMTQEWLRYLPGIDASNVGQVRLLLLGVGLILLMFLRPRGLLGQFRI